MTLNQGSCIIAVMCKHGDINGTKTIFSGD